MPHIVVFDLETREMADDVGGWDALKQGAGGVSAIAVWDSNTGRIHLYDDHTIRECAEHLEAADLVVGYNSAGFDVPIIEGLLGRKLRLRHTYDILTHIWDALRLRGDRKFKGNTLDEVAKRTIGRGKTGKGANAPELAKQGRWAELFSYCMNDTDLTRELFEHVIKKGSVNDMNGMPLPLEVPAWLKPKDNECPSQAT